MTNREIAQKIYEKLLEKGCVIGNASIPFIEQVLAESNQVEVGVKPSTCGLCKDCKHFKYSEDYNNVGDCKHPKFNEGIVFNHCDDMYVSEDFGCINYESEGCG